jgi:hypothetical protein
MRLSVALAGFVWLLGAGSAAHAEVLGSGALFSAGQTVAQCTVTNVSSSPASVSSVSILSSDGSPVSIPFENCNGALAPGHTCTKNANLLSQTLLYHCQVDTGIAGAVGGILGGTPPLAGARFRGTMIIFDSSNRILGTSDLR